ncbi:hypothetical protein YC2023_045860 [Brassica napus]
MITRSLQHGAWRIIEHGSHRAARSDTVRRVFSSGGRIVGCKIVYVIFFKRIIEHESHRAARSDTVRRVFSSGGRIVGYKIVYMLAKTKKTAFDILVSVFILFS